MEHGVELIAANNAKVTGGSLMMEHVHVCYQVYYILKGNPTFIVNGNEITVHPGAFFYISPQTPHQMLPLKDPELSCYDFKIQISDPFLLSRLPKYSKPVQDSGFLKHLIDYVYENWKCNDSQNISNIENILTTAMLNFILDELQYTQKDSCHIHTENYGAITRKIMAYIEENYLNHFSLDELSRELNYNRNYLSSTFTRNTGISIVDYLNLLRIRKAVIIIAFYSQDVYTTCESCGFSNPSHFSRTFKSMTGASPRSFKYVFSKIDRHQLRSLFTDEPILNQQICTLEEAFSSLRSIGETVNQLTQLSNTP